MLNYASRRAARAAQVVVTPEDVAGFAQRLAARSHDRYYQPIPLPYGQDIAGYERTARTWDYLLAMVEFCGRSVLDAGCYHCYVAFGAEDAGASKVTGVDSCQDAIDTARELAAIWGYETVLVRTELETWMPPEHYDVVICTNVIQHSKDPEAIVKTLFAAGDLVIWEAHAKFKTLFEQQKTHALVRESDGPRTPDLERRFYHYQRKA